MQQRPPPKETVQDKSWPAMAGSAALPHTAFFAAIRFLTVIPVAPARPTTPLELQQGLAFFPVVGGLLGLGLVGLSEGFERVLPGQAVNALLLLALIVSTGALHIDGFIDTCDGLFGGRTPQRRLEIMRDPRVGSYGIIGAVSLLLIKWSALLGLTAPVRWGALGLAPVISRWAMVMAVYSFPYARAEGLGTAFRSSSRAPLWVAGAITALASGLLFGYPGLLLFCGLSALAWGLGKFMAARVGGLTGDTYGAINETVETVALLVILGLARYDLLKPLFSGWAG